MLSLFYNIFAFFALLFLLPQWPSIPGLTCFLPNYNYQGVFVLVSSLRNLVLDVVNFIL